MDVKWLLCVCGGGLWVSVDLDWRDPASLGVAALGNQRLIWRRSPRPAKQPRAERSPAHQWESRIMKIIAPPRCLPQTDRAVQLLLETSADNPSYYCDSLKACLVTTITSSGPSQSTIKLVATNMIANGKLAGAHGTAASRFLRCLLQTVRRTELPMWSSSV